MLQRRLPFGGRVASVTTRATLASGIDALRPRPGLSASPSRPDLSKRTHHAEARFDVILLRFEGVGVDAVAEQLNTTLARSRSRTPMVVERDRRRSSFTTSGPACSRLIGRPIPTILPAAQPSSK